MPSHPSFRENLEAHRVLSLSAWRDRAIVWIAAAIAGLVVVGFTVLSDRAADVFRHLREASVWWPFLIMPAGGALVVWATQRLVPFAAGSGIPQVMAALSPQAGSAAQMSRLVSIRLGVGKVLLGSGALLAGFSTGREGPSVQIAASVMYGFRRAFGRLHGATSKDLVLAGGAAGIAAAFNAPLAGVVFAIEELTRRFEQRSSGVLITAIVLAGLVSISLLGNFTYFGRLQVSGLNWALMPAVIVTVLACGLVGGLFSRMLIAASGGRFGAASRFRSRHPVLFASACGLGVAALGYVSDGAAHGSGYFYTRQMLDGAHSVPLVYVGIKFLATFLSYWSGVPGGIFAPSLAIGAGLGNDVAALMGDVTRIALIAIGMTAFLAAVTQAPITAFIIVMEMVDGHALVLSLMASALLASFVSRWVSPPLYHSLHMAIVDAVAPPASPPKPG